MLLVICVACKRLCAGGYRSQMVGRRTFVRNDFFRVQECLRVEDRFDFLKHTIQGAELFADKPRSAETIAMFSADRSVDFQRS